MDQWDRTLDPVSFSFLTWDSHHFSRTRGHVTASNTAAGTVWPEPERVYKKGIVRRSAGQVPRLRKRNQRTSPRSSYCQKLWNAIRNNGKNRGQFFLPIKSQLRFRRTGPLNHVRIDDGITISFICMCTRYKEASLFPMVL